jgi:hypothetical protein
MTHTRQYLYHVTPERSLTLLPARLVMAGDWLDLSGDTIADPGRRADGFYFTPEHRKVPSFAFNTGLSGGVIFIIFHPGADQ